MDQSTGSIAPPGQTPLAQGDPHRDGRYLANNPGWHVGDSAYKVQQITAMLRRHGLTPLRVGEAGCGAGEVLRLLQGQLAAEAELWGYDISPQAIQLAAGRANPRLHFMLADVSSEPTPRFDLLLVLDVLEHVPDYLGWLARLRGKSEWTLFHIPLAVTVESVLRQSLLGRRAKYGHLHYFTQETALATLRDVGFQVVDWCFSPYAVTVASGPAQKLARVPRRLAFALAPEWAARVFGGYHLLVLAR